MWHKREHGAHGSDSVDDSQSVATPGKRTLTEALVSVQRQSERHVEPTQRNLDSSAPELKKWFAGEHLK